MNISIKTSNLDEQFYEESVCMKAMLQGVVIQLVPNTQNFMTFL